MKCQKCGWPLPEDSVFCQYCGEKVEVKEETLAQPLEGGEEGSRAQPEPPVPDTPETRTERKEEAVTPGPPEEPRGATPPEEPAAAETPPEDTAVSETPTAEREAAPTVKEVAGPSPGEAPAQVDARAAKKQRYCKRCGSPVDRKTKKCQGCGKQYFRLRRFGVWMLGILCLALVGLNILQYTQLVSTQGRLEQVSSTLSVKERMISYQSAEISSLKKEADTYMDMWLKERPKVGFMDYCVVIVGNSNNRYHKYGCEDLDMSSVLVYNPENARAQGHRACKKCIE